jgi:L-ribulose-5-phosphate 3-epimerase
MNETPRGRAAFAINTYSFSRDRSAHDCLQQLASVGYRRFEVMLIPGHFWPTLDGIAGRREVEALVARNGLEILTLNQPNLDVNLASEVPEMREHSCTVVANAIELAAAWNAEGVVINPGKANPVFPPRMQTLTDNFKRSLDVLLLGYDFANGHFAGEAPEAVLGIWDHLSFLYAADTSAERFEHAEIGTGTVAFGAIATLLRGAGVCPPTILELLTGHPQPVIDASVEYLDAIRWPAA